ncbi:MAG: FMN-binding protein [Candidatus Cloacimonadaceae bacterium]|nr:FMN-binding protein [Candidatus Cloacimonadaceae bacterium]
MKYYLKLGLILLIFCAVASGILAYINSLTAPVVKARKLQEEIDARNKLIPDSDFEEISVEGDKPFSYFVAYLKGTKEIQGYTFIAAETGYSSKILTMAGMDKNYKIINITVIDQAETPGLGANCTAISFTEQYKGLGANELAVDKDGGKKIKSLTGATITARAISNSLKKQIARIVADIENRQGEQL